MNHLYVSTWCQHGRCSECRQACKVCDTQCLCSCHQPGHETAQAAVAERISETLSRVDAMLARIDEKLQAET